jgi:ribosomal-protein-serine acetyltransferase
MDDLVARPWTEDDAPALQAAVVASTEHLRPWMAWVTQPLSLDERRAWIRERRAQEAAGGDRFRGVFVGGEVAGGGGLHQRVGPDGWELGYWVHVAWTGRGVATGMAGLLAAEAFADPAIAFVAILHDVANHASGAVARKAGFTFVDEVDREPAAPADTGRDRRWHLTRADWEARAGA